MSLKGACKIFFLVALLTIGLAVMNGVIAAEKIPSFKSPIMISTAGQSIDMYTVKALCNKAGLKSEVLPLAKFRDLQGINTLIMVPAHSNKGLGAAGIDVNGEMERVKALLKGAKRLKIDVVLVHVGGQIRRSADSDPFISEVLSYPPKFVAVYKDGNKDRFFTKRCSAAHIPLVVMNKVVDLTGVLKKMFVTK
jgi:hypothetical protein